jgi:hypothetical protein
VGLDCANAHTGFLSASAYLSFFAIGSFDLQKSIYKDHSPILPTQVISLSVPWLALRFHILRIEKLKGSLGGPARYNSGAVERAHFKG